MADPPKLLAKAPHRRISSILYEDASTVLDSELSKLSADTNPERYVHSDGLATHYEEYARITGFDVDYTDRDDLTFPGFRSMRHCLSAEAAHHLVTDRRWCNIDDPVDVVGQKNVIIIFVCIATVEECLVDEKSETTLPVVRQFQDLMDLLGISDRPTGRPRNYKFLEGIRTAFVSSRASEIKGHLQEGKALPPEPSDLPVLGRMLLDVMDRHIAFLRTLRPLTRLCEPMPLEKLLRLRLLQIKNQLRSKEGVEECFTTFVPTIPADQQTFWPRAGMATAWKAAQAKLTAKQSEPTVDSKSSMGPKQLQPTEPGASSDAHDQLEAKTGFTIPGIPATGPVLPLHSASDSPAGHGETGHLNALLGLRMFKTACCQAHKAIRGSRDSMDFRNFVGLIEHDIEQCHAGLQLGPALPRTGPAGSTGIVGSKIDVLWENQNILSYIKVGLGLIRKQWDEQHLTDDLRQKILYDITEELRMIKEAADQICSGGA